MMGDYKQPQVRRRASFRSSRVALLPVLVGFLVSIGYGGTNLGTRPGVGIKSNPPDRHALVGLRIVCEPGKIVEDGIILIADGVIESIELAEERVPSGYRRWDLRGKTAYAGFIDAYSEIETSVSEPEGTRYWNRQVTPERLVSGNATWRDGDEAEFRNQGILMRLVGPNDGIIKGQSVIVTTEPGAVSARVVRDRAAMHLRLTVPRSRDRNRFPNSPMGAVALARQALLDAQWYEVAQTAYQNQLGLPQPERNGALAVLVQSFKEGQPFIVDVSNEQFYLRAHEFAREFALPIIIRGSGREYRQLEAVRETARPVVVPVDFPLAPDVSTSESLAEVSLTDLMHWELAPENPGRLDAAGVKIALTAHGLKKKSEFLKQVRKAVRRGLGAGAALAAMTTTPASLLGVQDKVGTIEAGKMANLVIADGDIFEGETTVTATWVRGQRFRVEEDLPIDIRGEWRVASDGPLQGASVLLEGKRGKPKGRLEWPGAEKDGEARRISLDKFESVEGRFRARFEDSLEVDGKKSLWRLTGLFLPLPKPVIEGTLLSIDGQVTAFRATRTRSPDELEKSDLAKKQPSEIVRDELLKINFPLGAFGLTEQPVQRPWVALEHATVWTCGPDGIIEDAVVLLEKGRVKAVGRNLSLPEGTFRLDVTGFHITPGIIDCHSHMATDSGVNESTQAVTAEVRIGDLIDANDINIYRQLAGGVTTVNILHGSANPIGGQNQVIKLRWGAAYPELRFEEAPAGIKFALGENVKHSNRGDEYTTRYPQTRMGVEQLIRDSFDSARAYGERLKVWNQSHQGLPPRRDLELEALWEILQGDRWIHCHSYRQDEILALIRILDDYGVTIGTFQHILEGYKVAPEMKRHGAMASSFSDWWGYKFEVLDAIPYNGALMHQAGLVVSFNSDDRELARHLNQEAAKAVKYGRVTPEEALKFVTLNPAKQLRVDQWVGSIEPGKHGDLVVWSGPPLENASRCLQTWIEGRPYFSVEHDLLLRVEADRLRALLVERILRSGSKMKAKGTEDDSDEAGLWPRHDEFCAPHHRHTEGDSYDY